LANHYTRSSFILGCAGSGSLQSPTSWEWPHPLTLPACFLTLGGDISSAGLPPPLVPPLRKSSMLAKATILHSSTSTTFQRRLHGRIVSRRGTGTSTASQTGNWTQVAFQQPQSPFDNGQDEIGWPIAPLHMAHFRLSFGPQ
jgi:hypothetical protein